MPDFFTLAYSLTKLTQKDEPFVWGRDQEQSFQTLKECLISSPILSYPKDKGQYIIDTDASAVGMGAVLSQIQEVEEKVIAYASKTFTRAQR